MSWKSFMEMVSSPSTTLNRYVMAGGAMSLAWLNDLFRGNGASGCDLTEHQYNLTQGSSHYRKCLVIRSPKPSGQISPPIREGPRWHHKAHASRCRDNKASREPHLKFALWSVTIIFLSSPLHWHKYEAAQGLAPQVVTQSLGWINTESAPVAVNGSDARLAVVWHCMLRIVHWFSCDHL